MKDFYISITVDDFDSLKSALFTTDGCENAAILLCGISDTSDGTRLLARRIIGVPPHEYIVREPNRLEVSPRFYNYVIDECIRTHFAPVLVHSHRFSGDAWYSPADDHGESRLFPVLESLIPSPFSASLVITETSITGRRWQNGNFVNLTGIKIVGNRTKKIGFVEHHNDEIDDLFNRQVLAIGYEGQRIIQSLKVGIIGLGGIGSIVAGQLAMAGIGKFILVDPDTIEASNVSRMPGTTLNDVGKPKVAVIEKLIREAGAHEVATFLDSALRQEILLKLRDCDVIFCCVDNDRSRATLMRFSYQYIIPLVDMGTRLDGREGRIAAAAGRISIVGNGMICLRCSHHLNADRIRAESIPAEERKALRREGYIIGIDEPAPAVISINTVVAGLGVTGGLNLFVEFTGGRQPLGQIYDAATGTVFVTDAIHSPSCDICDSFSGVKAIGDLQIVSAY